ncbi:MAG: DciA family protein [Phycisphaeraceae bacterium]
MGGEAQDQYLQRLRGYRNRRELDLSLGFLRKQFQREVARPHKQLAQIVEIWQRLVPEPLARHTRLESLSRGVLRVAVDSSAHLYELDQLLRSGLERQIVREHKGAALRRIKLQVAPFGGDAVS